MGKRWLVKLWFAERGKFRHVELRGNEWTIGRAPENDIELAKKTISKRHARLIVRDGKLAIVEPKPGQKMDKPLATENVEITVTPKEEWKQIFNDAWRFQRAPVSPAGGTRPTRYRPAISA